VKIKDITEGLYDALTGIAQSKKQADWAKSGGNRNAHMGHHEKELARIHQGYRAATAGPDEPFTPSEEPQIPNPQEGSVLLVTAPNGSTYFKTYTGSWHTKGQAAIDFSVGGTKVTAPKDIEVLDQLLPKAKLVGVKPNPRDASGNAWTYDQRKTALLAKRGGK